VTTGSHAVVVASLAAAMGAGHFHGTPYAAAYGYLKAAVEQFLEATGVVTASVTELDDALSVTELALLTYRTDLVRRRDARGVSG
jgi:hypothetical protein